jgi:hypothetical protein
MLLLLLDLFYFSLFIYFVNVELWQEKGVEGFFFA